MTAPGTAVAAVRARLIALLDDRPGLAEVAVGYEAPRGHYATETAAGLQMDTAERPAAVWLDAATEGQYEYASLRGLPLVANETWRQTIVVQVLPRDDQDDQAAMESLVADIVGEVLAAVHADPQLGLTVEGVNGFTVVAESFVWTAGRFVTGSAARCELVLSVEANRC